MKYDTNANIQKLRYNILHGYDAKKKVHKNTTRMGLEKPWDDPLVILEVVSIKELQVLAIHGKV